MAGLILVGSVVALWLAAWLAGWRRLSHGILAVLAGYVSLAVPFVVLINIFSDAVFRPKPVGMPDCSRSCWEWSWSDSWAGW
jgi:hypothetical protein